MNLIVKSYQNVFNFEMNNKYYEQLKQHMAF